ncbi:MAG: 3-deoxy-8-phosphooctulonate synthase [Spirochaetota bacterium]|nr:3-deoxy-8-phosphooctulonate synthase [Spirochaetota bacterium]
MINWLEKVGIKEITYAKEKRFVFIAGPCVLNDADEAEHIARYLLEIAEELGVPFVFKGSYDKANRTRIGSFRGPGVKTGLAILHHIRETYKIPVLSDVHSVEEVEEASKVLDFMQIPAFLCRQTDLIVAAAESNKVINVKKGPFLAPGDMRYVVEKIRSTGNNKYLITERGTSFGYNTLVNDFKSFPIMSQFAPVVYDASHSVQSPGGSNGVSGGSRRYIPNLTRAAIAAGAAGLYLEVHPKPEEAKSDSAVSFPLDRVKQLLEEALEIYQVTNRLASWGDLI